jgi:hypothetical protein
MRKKKEEEESPESCHKWWWWLRSLSHIIFDSLESTSGEELNILNKVIVQEWKL